MMNVKALENDNGNIVGKQIGSFYFLSTPHTWKLSFPLCVRDSRSRARARNEPSTSPSSATTHTTVGSPTSQPQYRHRAEPSSAAHITSATVQANGTVLSGPARPRLSVVQCVRSPCVFNNLACVVVRRTPPNPPFVTSHVRFAQIKKTPACSRDFPR